MKILSLIAVFLFLLSVPAHAQGIANVSTDLAADHVDITTGFNGATMTLFGTRKSAEGDIAVVIRGPLRTMYVRRKESIFGAWVNGETEKFKDVPSYYAYALGAPEEKFFADKSSGKLRLKPENLDFAGDVAKHPERREFHEALIRNKQKQGLFMQAGGEIKFIGPDFFRADFYIPANVPVGEYDVETMYFSGGVLKDSVIKKVRVGQVGMAARIHDFSRENALSYGILSVMLAIFAGWFSNRVRRG